MVLVRLQGGGSAGTREVLGQEGSVGLKSDWAVGRRNLAFSVAVGSGAGGRGKEQNVWFFRDRRWNLEELNTR